MPHGDPAAHHRPIPGPTIHAPMRARSPHESHRTATPLELFFDLVFVVAIAAGGGRPPPCDQPRRTRSTGLIGYAMVFFAIWWAWMNFTWFASAYDSDDVPYRLAVFVQITGALIMAAGVPAMFEAHGRRTAATIVGYVVMRLAMVAQWLRAARADPRAPRTARRYAARHHRPAGRVGRLPFLPVSVLPALHRARRSRSWRCRSGPNASCRRRWHPHHIAERYGLLTLIVLGESILAATVAIQVALAAGERLSALAADHRRRPADRLLDVVDVLRLAGSRSADQPAQGDSSGATATTSSSPRPPPSAPAWR